MKMIQKLAQFKLKSKDFLRHLTKRTLEVVNKSSNNKVVSILEGFSCYDLNALKESTEMHLNPFNRKLISILLYLNKAIK